MTSRRRSIRAPAALFIAGLACASCGGEGAPSASIEPPADAHAAEPSLDLPDDPPTARRGTLSELRVAHRARRHTSDGGGRAWLQLEEGSDGSIHTGTRGRWTIVYEAGPLGIDVGGTVRLLVPPFWEWSPAQNEVAEAPGYTTVESPADGLELEVTSHRWFEARIAGRRMESGEQLLLHYGSGRARAAVDVYAERESRFWIAVDGDGDGVQAVLKDSPGITVHPGQRPDRLRLTLPSVVRPGEPVRLTAAVLDRAANAGLAFEGQLELESDDEAWELPEPIAFAPADGGLLTLSLRAPPPGVHRLRGRLVLGTGELLDESNPMLVSADAPEVRWGDLHGHSNLSDGTGTPEDYFRYAREAAALDVVALTDHDHWGVLFLDENPELWDRIRDATAAAHEPGRFVTLLGYEWTNWIHGHRHVLYPGDDGPVLSAIDPAFETPRQLWDGLAERGLEALTFAHHSAGGPIATNWDYEPDERFEPVTEIVSVHGSSEAPDAPVGIYSPLRGNYVRDVLDRGLRLGFIGSGDSHDGHPGLAHMALRSGGLAALLTDDLTRAGVFAALRARRSYATNGERILMQCALNGLRMGSDVPAPAEGEPALLFCRVVTTAPLKRLDVVRNGRVEFSLPGEEQMDVSIGLEVEGLAAGEYVYVRAVQTDDMAAWSSPFFIR